jgi:acetyl-CoA synthetase
MNRPSEFGNPSVVPYAEAVANFRPEDIAAALHGSLEDGINACVECCDRHVAPGRIALEWESQDGRRASYTFAQLKELSARFGGFLKSADL